MVDGCAFVYWSDVSPSKVLTYIASMRAGEGYAEADNGASKAGTDAAGDTRRRRRPRPVKSRTCNFYLAAARQFLRWMWKDNRAPESPIAQLEGVAVDDEEAFGVFTPDELRTLIQKTEQGPDRFKVSGAARALIYLVAAETGLRAGELRTLTWDCVGLSATPSVTVKPRHSKGAKTSRKVRDETIPIGADLAARLKRARSGAASTGPVFPGMPDRGRTARMIRKDMEAAELKPCDATGAERKFHSLRHSFITNLALAGVSPKLAMDLARHTDINLTLRRYSHTLLPDRARAVDALPDLLTPRPNAERQRATGTDGQPVAANSVDDRDVAAQGPTLTEGSGERSDEACEAARNASERGADLGFIFQNGAASPRTDDAPRCATMRGTGARDEKRECTKTPKKQGASGACVRRNAPVCNGEGGRVIHHRLFDAARANLGHKCPPIQRLCSVSTARQRTPSHIAAHLARQHMGSARTTADWRVSVVTRGATTSRAVARPVERIDGAGPSASARRGPRSGGVRFSERK